MSNEEPKTYAITPFDFNSREDGDNLAKAYFKITEPIRVFTEYSPLMYVVDCDVPYVHTNTQVGIFFSKAYVDLLTNEELLEVVKHGFQKPLKDCSNFIQENDQRLKQRAQQQGMEAVVNKKMPTFLGAVIGAGTAYHISQAKHTDMKRGADPIMSRRRLLGVGLGAGLGGILGHNSSGLVRRPSSTMFDKKETPEIILGDPNSPALEAAKEKYDQWYLAHATLKDSPHLKDTSHGIEKAVRNFIYDYLEKNPPSISPIFNER